MSRFPVLFGLVTASLAAPVTGQSDPTGPWPVFANEELFKDAPASNGVSSCDDTDSRNGNDVLASQATCDTCPGGQSPVEIAETYEDTGDPILLHNGAVSYRASDLMIPGRGISFEMTRRYNSKRILEDSVMGWGWEFAFDQRIDFDNQPGQALTARLQNGNNRVDSYLRQPPAVDFFGTSGVYTRLYGENGLWVIRARHGSRSYFEHAPIPKRQNSYRLVMVEDASGNHLIFDYFTTQESSSFEGRLQKTIDSLGREITFQYVLVGAMVRLQKVVDHLGREVVYSYDAAGNLETARSPVVTSTGGFNDFPSGRTEKYTYVSGTSLLSGIIRPSQFGGTPETPFVTFAYHAWNPTNWWSQWVKSQTLGGATINYEYNSAAQVPTGDLDIVRLYTTVTDRRGNATEYWFNENGNVLRKKEYTNSSGAFVETKFKYNADGEILEVTYPLGNKETRTYHSATTRFQAGNVHQVKLERGNAPDVDLSTDVLTTTYEWEPVFNHLYKRTDPRGFVTEFVLDYMEGSATLGHANDVAPSVANELGMTDADARTLLGQLVKDADLNGDGIGGPTNPGVTVNGLVVQRIEPPVTLDHNLGGDPQEAAEGGGTTQEAISSWTYNVYGQVTSQTDAEENVSLFAYTPHDDLDSNGLHDITGSSTVAATGGLPRRTIEDTALPYSGDFSAQFQGLVPRALSTDVGRNKGLNPPPAPTGRTTDYFYSLARQVIAYVDGRGVRHELSVNELDEVWQVHRGVNAAAASTRQGGAPEEPNEAHLAGTAFTYVTKLLRDANGLVTRRYVTNSGETPDDNGFWETAWAYDILNNVRFTNVEKSGGTFVSTETQYDANENVVMVIAPVGTYTRYEYDARDQVKKTFRGQNGPAQEHQVEEREYDGNGNVTDIYDGKGQVTEYEYDEFDRLHTLREPNQLERMSLYDTSSNVTELWERKHAGGGAYSAVRSTKMVYDERSRPWRVDRRAEGGQQALTDGALTPNDGNAVSARLDYDRLSRRTFSVEDDNQTYEAHYDGLSRKVWTKDPMGNIRTGSFDDESNLVKHTESDDYPGAQPNREFWTWRQYDALGRLTLRMNQIGEAERYGYDSRDQVIAASDPEAPGSAGQVYGVNVNPPGNTRSYRYDGRGLLLTEILDLRIGGNGAGSIDTSNPFNTDGKVTLSQEWDNNGRLLKRFDDNQGAGGNGTFTAYEWDFRDRLLKEIFADTTQIERTYDGNDNVLVVTDARSNHSTRGYDTLDRLTSITLDPGSPSSGLGTTSVSFAYDGLGRRLTAIANYAGGSSWQVDRTYDALDRILTETQNATSSNPRMLTYTWKEEAKLNSVLYPTAPLGVSFTVDYVYDALDRVSKIRTNTVDLAGYKYAGPDRKLERSTRNRAMARWHDGSFNDAAYYDNAKRQTKLEYLNILTQAQLGSFEHAYNRVGSRKWEKRTHDSGKGDNYGHDSLYRLTKFERRVPAADIGTLGLGNDESDRSWDLDGVHNWRQFTLDSTTSTASVDEVHEYSSFGPAAPAYDLDGNLTSPDSAGTTTLQYDFLNRLVRVAGAGGAVLDHVYDAEGRRVRTVFTNITGAPLQRDYVYDDWDVIEEHETATNPAPPPATIETFMRRYVMGISTDEPICMEALPGQVGTRTLYYMQSTLGHVVGLTNNVGDVVERYTYDAYGQPRFENASNIPLANQKSAYGNPYLFTGRRYEPWIMPLYEYRNRFYLPEQGRFLQRDPLGRWADLLTLGNALTYVAAGPCDLRDPLGLSSDPWGDFLENYIAPAAGAVTGFLDDTTAGALSAAGEFFHGTDKWQGSIGDPSVRGGYAVGERTSQVAAVVKPVATAAVGVVKVVKAVRAGEGLATSMMRNLANSESASLGARSRLTKDTGKIAHKLGLTVRQVRRALEKLKQDNLRGGKKEKENPDVAVDPSTGEVHPIGPDGRPGDSIGNILDYVERCD